MKKAFTLIELLVVIAIIAILAAILFPVFAQAKAAAKGTAELSNTNQLNLAALMYNGDYDDYYTFALDNAWQHTWASNIQPYVKSVAAFYSPFDTAAGKTLITWAGATSVSFGANGYITNFGTNGAGNSATNLAIVHGPFEANAQFWENGVMSATAITQPAATITFGPKYQADEIKYGAGDGNTTGFCGATFMTFYSDTGVASDGGEQSWDWCGFTEIPNGAITTPGTTYPLTRSGAVSIGRANVANFSFCDGHSKSMNPIQTNPDGDHNVAANLWDGLR
jgi:prepilin-type N-terminal cleavage/methylation domain-containing protein/prepilin-type processing-associated H-X9-DG protein